jgi:hypothetical protein
MAESCCSSTCKTETPKTHRCPSNGVEYREVSSRTIAHHINEPWLWNGKNCSYYFCDDPECDVVYFGDDDSFILKSQLRTEVGIKSTSEHALLCYCFGVTKADAQQNPAIKSFVVEQTKQKLCSCETSNPSGRCCLKDFPRGCSTK